MDLNDSRTLSIIAAVVLVVLTFVLFKFIQSRRTARRSVLLLGLCGSGKTLIWSRIIHGRNVQTHTSIMANVGDYQTNKGMLKVVDIPGHERVRYRFFDQHKSAAKAIIFVIDALTFQSDIRDVAEFLYLILSDNTVLKSNPAILILAHKQDQTLAKGSTLIQSNLEREFNLLRQTKDNQLESISEKSSSSFLGKQDKNFSFSDLNQSVEFAETNAVSDNVSDLEPVQSFLASLS